MGKIEKLDASFSPKVMFPLAIADSIDALAVGVTFAFRQVPLVPSVPVIGLTTFLVLGGRRLDWQPLRRKV